MTKAILISINPQHALNILQGHKTLELRKSVPKGFVGWVYMYVTKSYPALTKVFEVDMGTQVKDGVFYTLQTKSMIENGAYAFNPFDILNGSIVARWWHDGYYYYNPMYFYNTGIKQLDYLVIAEDREALCLEDDDIRKYGNGKDLYAWKISKLEIFDKPMELGEFYKLEPEIMYNNAEGVAFKHGGYVYNKLFKAPQSFQTVWVKGE
jgi:predicted transcriptional regulator